MEDHRVPGMVESRLRMTLRRLRELQEWTAAGALCQPHIADAIAAVKLAIETAQAEGR